MGTQGCRAVAVTNAYENKIPWSTFVYISRNLVRDDPQHAVKKVRKLPAGGRLSEDSQMKMLQQRGLQGHRQPSPAEIPVTRGNASEARENTGGCRPRTGLD